MKKSRISICLLPLLLLTSCQGSYESFAVPYNLDYQFQESDHYSPISIKAKELRTMIESKQSFAFYYYSENCSHCPNSTELLNKYLQVKNNQIEFYKISSTEYFIDKNSDNHLQPFSYLFDTTPNIYFFKEGELQLSLPRNKYSSGFPVFESTLNEILRRCKIYTTTILDGVEYFLNNNNNYLIYLRNIDDVNYENSYVSYSYDIYQSVVYTKMIGSEYSTLVLDVNDIDYNVIEYLNNEYGILNYNSTNLAIYKYTSLLDVNNTEQGIINYSDQQGVNELIEVIDNNFLNH